MKKLITILLIMFSIQAMGQGSINNAYQEYCTEGVKMNVDSTLQRGEVEIEIILTDDGIKYGKRDTTWFNSLFTYGGTISNYGYSCSNSHTTITSSGVWTHSQVVKKEPIRIDAKKHYSKLRTTITFDISRMVYQEYYYKEPKESFEDWLKAKKYLR